MIRKLVGKIQHSNRCFIVTIMACAMLLVMLVTYDVWFPKRVVDIRLERTGQNALSLGGEFRVNFIKVDGEYLPLDQYLTEGWQYDGTLVTHNIGAPLDLSVSVARKVEVGLKKGPWMAQGLVQVGDSVNEIDFYSEIDYQVFTEMFNVGYVFYLLVILVVIGVFIIGIFVHARLVAVKLCHIKQFVVTNAETLFIISLALLILAEMIVSGRRARFWGDELYTLSIASASSFIDLLKLNLGGGDLTGLLLNIIMALWNRITPYGEVWLLIVPQLFASAAVFCIGMCARTILKETAIKGGGALAAVISSTMLLWSQNGNNLRPYSLTLLFSVLLIWAYTIRLRQCGHENVKSVVLLGLCMLGISLTYFIAALMCGFLFIIDCFLLAYKKIHAKCLLSYAIPLAALIVILFMLIPTGFNINNLYFLNRGIWGHETRLSDMINYIRAMLDGNTMLLIFYLFGLSIISFNWLHKKNYSYLDDLPIQICGIMPLLVGAFWMVIDFMQNGTYWENRHFIMLSPLLIITTVYGILNACKFMFREEDRARNICLLVLSFTLFLVPMHYQRIAREPDQYVDHFKELGVYLRSQSDIYQQDTGVYSNQRGVFDSFVSYYFTEKGRYASCTMINSINNEILQYSKVYVINYWGNISAEQMGFMNEHYDLIEENGEWGLMEWQKKA